MKIKTEMTIKITKAEYKVILDFRSLKDYEEMYLRRLKEGKIPKYSIKRNRDYSLLDPEFNDIIDVAIEDSNESAE